MVITYNVPTDSKHLGTNAFMYLNRPINFYIILYVINYISYIIYNIIFIILLLESACPFVRPSVTFFTPSDAQDVSATKRATGDPLVSKRPDFQGLFGFSKKILFWISGFLDFWIFLDFRLYLGNGKSYWRSAGVKTTGFSRAFGIFKKI